MSRNYSTGLGVIRSLGEAGYTVDLIASTKKRGSSAIASKSRYVRRATEVNTPDISGSDGHELVDALVGYARSLGKKAVLIPTDDFTASVTARYRDRLSELFLMPGMTGELTLDKISDKSYQSQLAEECGLPVPRERTAAPGELPEGLSYPCFVKPRMSIEGSKTEMAVCRDERELEATLTRLRKSDPERVLLVQEYLSAEREYSVPGLCTGDSVYIPAVLEKTRTARHERGVAVTGRVMPPELLSDILPALRELVLKTGYVGLFDIDILLCGGVPYFTELNLRSGGTSYAVTACGVNLPDMLVRTLTGEPLPESVKIKEGRSFVYEKVAWEEHIYAGMSLRELRLCLVAAQIGLLINENDKRPGRIFRFRIILSAIKHRLLRLFGLESAEAEPRPPDAVIVGRNWGNLLCTVRALGAEGLRVAVVRLYRGKPRLRAVFTRMRPEKHSRYTAVYRELVTDDSGAGLLELLSELAAGEKTPYLIPTDDFSAFLTDKLREELSPHYKLPGLPGGMAGFMDKAVQKKLASECGLRVASAVILEGGSAPPEGIAYPCFVKPAVSVWGSKAAMRKCSDEAELRAVLGAVRGSVICEEWLDIAAEYSILGYARDDTVSADCVFRSTLCGHRERSGVAVAGVTADPSELGNVPELCRELVRRSGYTGLFDIDLIKTADGSVYFTEMNLRAGASVHAFTALDANLPARYCGIRGIAKAPAGVSFVSEKLLLEELSRGDISPARLKAILRSADIRFAEAAEDPGPARYIRPYFIPALIANILSGKK